jgi:hypothetical protein
VRFSYCSCNCLSVSRNRLGYDDDEYEAAIDDALAGLVRAE